MGSIFQATWSVEFDDSVREGVLILEVAEGIVETALIFHQDKFQSPTPGDGVFFM